ncbi:hypothetical protein C8F01DRAFT_1106901 [Mycena amicta]|nr:hypothetical protein C8F01DRAFT_1106901 [Mycena amicta]
MSSLPVHIISSPKAPRSSHRRSSSSRSSPRQKRVPLVPQPSQPNYVGPPSPGFAPTNLHENDETFNMDPTTGVLDAGAGETYQAYIPPAGRRRFVGGFVGGLKKALWQRGRPGEPEPFVAYPEPAIIHEEETEYEPVPHAEMEGRYAPPEQYPLSPVPEASTSGHHAVGAETPYRDREEHYYQDPYGETIEKPGHERKESSTSTDTMHQTQEHYEGTTIVNHEPFVEPQPGPDYAKISPPPINDLPWISPDRVTVDYIPRGAREQMAMEDAMSSSIGSPRPRPRPRSGAVRRTTISWYNANQPPGSIDLLAGGSPLDEFGQPMMPKEIPMTFSPKPPPTQYPYTSPGASMTYANNMPIPPQHTPPRPPLAGAMGLNTPRRVPPPRYDPDIDGPPGSGTYRLPGSPRYAMGGYIPYEQLEPQQMAQAYTASTVSSVAPSGRRI